jgi:hypothetical protein
MLHRANGRIPSRDAPALVYSLFKADNASARQCKMPSDRKNAEVFPGSIQGAAQLFNWFGYWPSFHDAEIISLVLNRNGLSSLRLHTWHTTGQVDERGCYIKEKHVDVSFQMEEILSLALNNFSQQNVIFGLEIVEENHNYRVVLDPCYGLGGSITVRALSIELEPGSTGETSIQ